MYNKLAVFTVQHNIKLIFTSVEAASSPASPNQRSVIFHRPHDPPHILKQFVSVCPKRNKKREVKSVSLELFKVTRCVKCKQETTEETRRGRCI